MVTKADREAAEAFFPPDLWKEEAIADIAAAFARHRTASTAALTAEIQRLREKLEIGEQFLNSCNAAWAAGEPSHRVKKMLDDADRFRAALSTPSEVSEPDDAGAVFFDRPGMFEPVADHIGGEGEKVELAHVGIDYIAETLRLLVTSKKVAGPLASRIVLSGHHLGYIRATLATPPNTNGDAVREALEAAKKAEDAMREMFRYFDGGETRGSYDGKPERAGLRNAWYGLRSALATLAKHGGAEA